jgi:NAD(P)-dependent dehydrogenase (short-subunit alcohol dehydrogenase family)
MYPRENLVAPLFFPIEVVLHIERKDKEDDMNRAVLITGSTRGIGYATATRFLQHGDRVAIFCRHKRDSEEAIRRLLDLGGKGNVLGLTGDVRKPVDVERIVDRCFERFSKIDILVNNAGVGVYKPLEETNEKDWDRVIDTNLKGTFLFLHKVIPIMKQQTAGIVINISSGLGVEGMAGFSAYCASKFGVVGLTKVLADEMAPYRNIRIYAVLPGAVDTALLAGSGLEIDPSEVMKPAHVAQRIFDVAAGKERSGTLIEVYS